MKTEAENTNKEILVTPFGIDINKFTPNELNSIFERDEIVIGTIKTLENIYGIEYLIMTFKIVKTKLPDRKIKLLLVGEGTQRKNLEALAIELDLFNDIVFAGYVNHDEVENYHNILGTLSCSFAAGKFWSRCIRSECLW
ncbi:MAG: glycosyltransferase [Ignavibacteriales bacterium]|nr:glycosyltransferase [Ignavibacteriales bacterium]